MQIVSDTSGNYLPSYPAAGQPDISAVTTEKPSDILGVLEKKSRHCALFGNIAWGITLTASMPTMLAYFHMISERPETATICAAIGTGIIAVGLYFVNKKEEQKRSLDGAIRNIREEPRKTPSSSIKPPASTPSQAA